MTVIELDEMFLRELAKKLGELPRPTGDDLRERSWMTASQPGNRTRHLSRSLDRHGSFRGKSHRLQFDLDHERFLTDARGL